MTISTATLFDLAPSSASDDVQTQSSSTLKGNPIKIMYSKEVQTDDLQDYTVDEVKDTVVSPATVEEELRRRIKEELEQDMKLRKEERVAAESIGIKTLTADEETAILESEQFIGFLESSSKIIERALEEDYDVLYDYSTASLASM